MDAIAGFRKTEIIPIGKLQRAIDESDTESEPLSESEETASGQQALQTGGRGGADELSQQLESSQDWQDHNNTGQDDQHSDGMLPAEDLDADLEDLDNDELDYSRATTDPDLSGQIGQIDQSYQSLEGED
jgi:hypothetical protein